MAKVYHRLLFIVYLVLGTKLSVGQDNGVSRRCIISTAESQLEVRESTGHNDGPNVAMYLRYVGLSEGWAYCSAYACWSYGQNCIDNPHNAMAASWFPRKKIVYDRRYPSLTKPIKPADTFGIYFNDMGGIHHVGIIKLWIPPYVITLEANTNDTGSREGDGVYCKKRLIKQIYQVSSWLN